MVKILIPARRNSKGVPLKNRKLFDYTASTIPPKYSVHVFTDDEVIREYATKYGFMNIDRHPSSATDESTTKDMM
jgi:CMP-N-acetylneuraminic acid synthetase